MSEYIVIVTDRARARFFTLEQLDVSVADKSPQLVEQVDLVNEETGGDTRDLWQNTKSGRNRGNKQMPSQLRGAGPVDADQPHGYDDHRLDHEREMERRFLRRVADEALRHVDQEQPKTVVLVADKRALGEIRGMLNGRLQQHADIIEFPRELTRLKAHELHQRLASEALLPAERSLLP